MMHHRLQMLVRRLHAEQSGAIMLLLLAAFLILFMASLVVYDAGRSTQDKMDVQIAADSAAFSHTVVKARSMNMIAYANTIKRTVFSYLATYVNAWMSILIMWAYHASQCFKIFPSPSSCLTWAKAIPMIIAEGLEGFFTNVPAMTSLLGGSPRSVQELNALEKYQQYMYAITPWWAYIEGATRAMGNGAMMSASWPPPGSVVSTIKAKVATVIGSIDSILGTNVLNQFPSFTVNVDALPVTRRDRDKVWSTTIAPFNFSLNAGGFAAGMAYCLGWSFSLESIVQGAQVISNGSWDDPSGWKTLFMPLQLLPSLGCAFAAWHYNKDGYLDWKLKDTYSSSRAGWLKSTSTVHIAYKPRAGRNDDDEGRRKYKYMTREADEWDEDLYKNEGYFAMARSELVYKQPFEILNDLNAFFASIPAVGGFINNRLGLQHEPDMWSPRWKSKNRPLILPGERFGSAVQGPDAGLDTVINDTIPFLVLGSFIGLIPAGQSEPFTVASGVRDLSYLFRVGKSFKVNELEGLAK